MDINKHYKVPSNKLTYDLASLSRSLTSQADLFSDLTNDEYFSELIPKS